MTGEDSTNTRLNKYLALQLGISRREADELIDRGAVTVSGTVATLGARFTATDDIAVNGRRVIDQTPLQYLLFHKPVGYVCSRRAQGDSPTIYDLIPAQYHALKPVGRLDKDSSGLLLLTNDGDFAYQMTHPKFYKVKTYEVELDHDLQPLHQQMISDYGIQLEDGPSKFVVEKLEVEPLATSFSETSAASSTPAAYARGVEREAVSKKDGGEKAMRYRIIMSEGRNRQIRRTFAALGYEVTGLHRTDFGNYSLSDMKPGELKSINIQ